jgi:hypothetical protein
MYLALECAEVDALKALPVVSAPGIHRPKNKAKAKQNDWYVQPTLNCTGCCGGKRQPKFHCSEVLPTIGDVLHAARLFIEKEHAECIRLATEAKDTPASAEPSLQPPALLGGTARAQRRDAADEALRAKVQAHAGAVCATSPHQRDVMRRRVAPHLVEEKSALILMMSVYVGGHFD